MRAILSAAILAGVMGIGFAYVVHDGAVDVGRFVTFVPIGAVAVLVLALLARALTGGVPGPVRPRVWHRGNPLVLAISGLVGFAVFGFGSVRSQADVIVFDHDASCAGTRGAVGACRDSAATIVDAFHTIGRRTDTYDLAILTPDGVRRDVTLGRRIHGDVYAGAQARGDRRAFVRLYRDRVIAVSTASGYALTKENPQEKRDASLLITGLCGLGAVIGFATLRSRASA